MRSRISPRLRTLAVWVFLTVVAVNSVLGIWALMAENFGQRQGQILLTSLLLSAAVFGLLINAEALARRTLWPIPAVAAVGAILTCGIVIGLVWTDPEDEVFWLKMFGSFLTLTGAATLVGLLGLLRLTPRDHVVRQMTNGAIGALGAATIYLLWTEPSGFWIARVIGVLAVLVTAGSFTLPVLSRFRGPIEDRSVPTPIGFCPLCGQPLAPKSAAGIVTRCVACSAAFEVLADPVSV